MITEGSVQTERERRNEVEVNPNKASAQLLTQVGVEVLRAGIQARHGKNDQLSPNNSDFVGLTSEALLQQVSEKLQNGIDKKSIPTDEEVLPEAILSEFKQLDPQLTDDELRLKIEKYALDVARKLFIEPDHENDGPLVIAEKALKSIEAGENPELSPLTAGGVAWYTVIPHPPPGDLDDILAIYNARFNNLTETNKTMDELTQQITLNPTIPMAQKTYYLKALRAQQLANQARLSSNETRLAKENATLMFAPEFPSSADRVIEIVQKQLAVAAANVGSKFLADQLSTVQVTELGVTQPITLGDPRFVQSALAQTLVMCSDGQSRRLYEYLEGEVRAVERITNMATAWMAWKRKEGINTLGEHTFGNESLAALGTLRDNSGGDLGLIIGEVLGIYYQMAIDSSKDANFNLRGTSLKNFFRKNIPASDENEVRRLIRNKLLINHDNGKYAEQMAYNLAFAFGFSSDGNGAGTMSGTAHAAWVDRVFHMDVWRPKKEDKSGPEATFYDGRLSRRFNDNV